MKHPAGSILCAVFLAVIIFALPATAQQPCESPMSIKIPNVTITSVEKGDPGYELAAQGGGFMNTPAQKIRPRSAGSRPYRLRAGQRVDLDHDDRKGTLFGQYELFQRHRF